jgi:hypothetical protein
MFRSPEISAMPLCDAEHAARHSSSSLVTAANDRQSYPRAERVEYRNKPLRLPWSYYIFDQGKLDLRGYGL